MFLCEKSEMISHSYCHFKVVQQPLLPRAMVKCAMQMTQVCPLLNPRVFNFLFITYFSLQQSRFVHQLKCCRASLGSVPFYVRAWLQPCLCIFNRFLDSLRLLYPSFHFIRTKIQG